MHQLISHCVCCLSVSLPACLSASICPLISIARSPSAFRSLLYCLCHRLLLFLTLLPPVTLLSAFISIIFLSCHTHLPPFFPRLHILPSFFFFFFPGVNVRRCRLCSPHQAHGAPAVRVWAVWFVPTYCGVKKEKGGRNGTLNCSETGCEEAHPLRKPPLNLRCTVQPYIIKAKWILWKKSTSWISYFLPSRSIF